MNRHQKASVASVTWVTLALVASAIEPLVVKLGYRASISVMQLSVLKLLTGALFIFPIYRHVRWIGWPELGRVATASALFIATYALIYLSLETLPAVTLITVVTTTPAVVAIINQVRGKEHISLRFWMGFALCLVGVLLTIQFFEVGATSLLSVGVILALGSVLTSALYRTRMETLTRRQSPYLLSGYIFLLNGIVGILCLPWIGSVPNAAWPIVFWLGFAAAVANIAFLSAMRLIGATRLSVLTVLQRPLVIVASALVLQEPMTYTQIVGVILVLGGIQLAKVVKKSDSKPSPVAPSLIVPRRT